MIIPRAEYPRPQMVRKEWMNLNGEWEFVMDFARTGRERGLQDAKHLEQKILVPFCPESELSGVGYLDMMNAVWYKRSFTIQKENIKERILLHFEAVDYFCEVWVNGHCVGRHSGGYTPFTFDITEAAKEGENLLTVYVEDDIRSPLQPRGKQAESYHSQGCDYTRVTGIWQTVWLEFVPKTYIESYRLTPDVGNQCAHVEVKIQGDTSGMVLLADAFYEGKQVGKTQSAICSGRAEFTLALSELHLWEPLDARLYDYCFALNNGKDEVDKITGYFGMRSLELTDDKLLINGKAVFLRTVLDQGYYADGIYTAPSEKALKKDIELSIALGFNGARLHQKVFERRYLYWADRMGYLVFGEYGSWGIDVSRADALEAYLEPWMEAVERDYNSPAVIGWIPMNETWDRDGRRQNSEVIRNIYRITKDLDHTRPVIDTSGLYHVVTDIYDIHDYEQDVKVFAEHYEPMKNGGAAYDNYGDRQRWNGEPYFISEYGGIYWNTSEVQGWGYGNAPKTVEEFVERYTGLAEVMFSNPKIFALCYTQLYDVEQEKNGLYNYDRTPKFNADIMKRLRDAMTRKAAIEEEERYETKKNSISNHCGNNNRNRERSC